MIQWSRVCLSVQGTLGSPLVEEDPMSCRASKLRATTAEPELWSPCSATRRATTMRSLHVATEEQLPLTATGESALAARKTQHSNQSINSFKIYIKKRLGERIGVTINGWCEIVFDNTIDFLHHGGGGARLYKKLHSTYTQKCVYNWWNWKSFMGFTTTS